MPQRTPLGNLIQGSLEAHGWSARKIEEISGGHNGLGRGNITRLMNLPLTSLKGETLTALAEVLGLPTELVLRAALRSLKEPIELASTAGTPEDAIRLDTELSEQDKHTLLQMLEFMRTKQGDGNAQRAAPMTRAGESPATKTSPVDVFPSTMDTSVHMGTADDAIHPGEEGWVAPPSEYVLAADDSPSEGRERRRAMDEGEDA